MNYQRGITDGAVKTEPSILKAQKIIGGGTVTPNFDPMAEFRRIRRKRKHERRVAIVGSVIGIAMFVLVLLTVVTLGGKW